MNPNVTRAGPSTIRALHSRRKPTSIDLGLGEPTLRPDIELFERATRWIAEHGCRYSPNAGDLDLREAIAAHYGYPTMDTAASVCVTTGSQEAVYVAMKAIIDPAQDELLIVEPAFPAYVKIAEVEGITVRRVSMDPSEAFAFNAERILEAVGPRTRMIVLCSPCNPTGRIVSEETVRRIGRGLLERPGPPVFVLHDEIYREQTYIYDAGQFGMHYPHTIAVNSLSKSNALTGLRLGWVIAPAAVCAEITKMHGYVTSCASTFAQRIAYEIVSEKQLDVQRPWYAAQRDAAIALARETGLEFIVPDGAFYLCLRAGVADTTAFCFALLEERDVVAVPGRIFAESFEGWVRTSFLGTTDAIGEGYRRIADMAAVTLPSV